MKIEVPTSDLYLSTVMERAICETHVARPAFGGTSGGPSGPCWAILMDNGDISLGVCNERAVKAGFVGKVSPQSINRVSGAPRFNKKK